MLCGFINISKQNYRAEIGYELHRGFWNKGIATLKLLEKHNFVREGLLRK